MNRRSREFKTAGTQETVRQHNVATQRLRNGRGVTNSPKPAGLTTRPIFRFSSDSLQASATSDTSGPSFIEDVGGLDGGDDAEAQKLGTGRLCDTPMSGSPPDDWTLPDGMEPVAPAPTETDDDADTDGDGGESASENTLAAALGGDGR